MYKTIIIITNLASFILAFQVLYTIDFEKIMPKGRKPLLVFLLSMALGHLVASFLLAITIGL